MGAAIKHHLVLTTSTGSLAPFRTRRDHSVLYEGYGALADVSYHLLLCLPAYARHLTSSCSLATLLRVAIFVVEGHRRSPCTLATLQAYLSPLALAPYCVDMRDDKDI